MENSVAFATGVPAKEDFRPTEQTPELFMEMPERSIIPARHIMKDIRYLIGVRKV